MSRSRTRARRSRARNELIRAEFKARLKGLLDRVEALARPQERTPAETVRIREKRCLTPQELKTVVERRSALVEEVIDLFHEIETSDAMLSPFAEQLVGDAPTSKYAQEDHEVSQRLIAQIVAPHFTGRGRRHEDETGDKRCRNVLRKLKGKGASVKEQVQLYTQQTGRSREDFLIRRLEIESGDFDDRDVA